MEDSPVPQQTPQMDTPPFPSVLEPVDTPVAGPSSTPVPPSNRRVYNKKAKKNDNVLLYTTAFVPGMVNIKNPAGDFLQKESNVDVVRQISLGKIKKAKAEAEDEKQRLLVEEKEVPESNPLEKILVIHPGSRNLRIGRASDFYPHEIPNCIARPSNAPNRGYDPPVPGSRGKRVAAEQAERKDAKKRKGPESSTVDANGNGNGEDEEEMNEADNVDENIGHLRDYLRNRLIQERLATDWKEGARVKTSNTKVRPEPLPEHNDPYRIDWTEPDGRPFYVGTEALRLPENSGYTVRYPILQRSLNKRDWISSQLLLDDIAAILGEALRTELGVSPMEYADYSVVFIIPDHGDRTYAQTMIHLLLSVFGFKEIAVQQESYCAIFSAGMSSACVVDVGAQQTSVTCVDDGLLIADSRITLNYGGDDITSALSTLLRKSNFPYRDLDLAKSQEWSMMDNLKMKICTLEEHLVANTPWDFYVLKTEGLTQKFVFRTYDENILAPLIFFDTRMIDFAEKKGKGSFRFWNTSDELVTDEITTGYDEATAAMRACTQHLLPAAPPPIEPAAAAEADDMIIAETTRPTSSNGDVSDSKPAAPSAPIDTATPTPGSATSTPAPPVVAPAAAGATTGPQLSPQRVINEASRSPLDAAIAASISMCGTENKVKVAASSILLIGGGSALKGLGAFLADRIPPLLRRKGFPISDISIVPPPRNLNPRFVPWKGASVMCNLDSLSDMWIGKDEWDAIGARALKDRYLFF